MSYSFDRLFGMSNKTVTFNANEKVGGPSADDAFAPEWCKSVVISKLNGVTEMTPEKCKTGLQDLSDFLAKDEQGGDWYSLKRADNDGPWRACIHDGNTLVGVLRHDKPRGGAEYYGVVMSGAGHVGQELHNTIRSTPDMTASELVGSEMYQRAQTYAHKNAKKILAHLGTALDAEVESEEDIDGYWPTNSGARAPPKMAVPDFQSQYNVLHDNKDGTVTYHHRAVPGEKIVGGKLADPIDPLYGFVIRDVQTPDHSMAIGTQARHKQSSDCGYYMDLKNVGQLRKTVVSQYTRPDGLSPSSQNEAFWKYDSKSAIGSVRAVEDMHLKPHHLLINVPASSKQ